MSDYRIDDLARAAGTTVRNVRVYQDRGLLPPPRREGRVGWYAESHLLRLRLIGRLLERGYTFSVIGELLDAWEQGRDLREVLGLEEELTRPWSDELPGRVTLLELRKMFGGVINPRTTARAEQLRLIVREGAHFVVPSPKLLQAGVELVAVGVSLDEVLDIAEALQRDMDLVADRFVRMAVRLLMPEAEMGQLPPDNERARSLAELIRRLRPQAVSAITASFAGAMSRRVNQEVDEVNRKIRSGGRLHTVSSEEPAAPAAGDSDAAEAPAPHRRGRSRRR